MKSDANYKVSHALNASVELVCYLGVLKEIRANKIDVAIELLESAVDSKVSIIGRHFSQFASSKQDLLLHILIQVRDYRDKHPRTPNKDLLQKALVSTSNIDEIVMDAAEAANILERLTK